MNSETKTCQNCKQNFIIEPEDFEFYAKIKVPAPTFCPECRMQRRFLFRNERSLYKRTCDLCKKGIISIFPNNTEFLVYCLSCWWSDKWDVNSYAKELDFSKPFFEQVKKLRKIVPRPHTANSSDARLVNSDYTNCAGDLKDCYLVYGALNDWNCYYSHYINNSRDSFDNLYVFKSENCYECFDIESCYNLSFSQSCLQCRDSIFLFDCRNCSDCIACSGLRNKSYHIFNKPYSKEEYLKKKEEIISGRYSGLSFFKEKFYKDIYFQTPRKFFHGQMNKNFSGDYIANTEKTFQSFYIKKARNCKFCYWVNNAQDVYDYFAWGDVELVYEAVSMGDNSYNCKFCATSWIDKDVQYADICFGNSDLFGCVGLKKKQYCILNKQYTKEEYEQLVPKIIEHMNNMPYVDKKGRVYKYGEFFPPELSPFSYNETIAQEYFPLTKEQAIEQGYSWKEPEERNIKPTITSDQLPDHIKDVSDTIIKEIIECAHKGECNEQCTTAFKIIPQELEFYRKMNLPLPRLCPNCRHYQRLKQRNPLKLWHRQCQCQGQTGNNSNNPNIYQNTITHAHGTEPCPNEFETTYSPDRKEIVYCEKCYQQEVV